MCVNVHLVTYANTWRFLFFKDPDGKTSVSVQWHPTAVHQRKSSTFWSNWRISFHPASILQTTCRKFQLPLFFHLFDEPNLVDFFFSFSFDDGLTITLEVAFCSFQSTLIWITQLMCYDLKMKLHCLYLPAYSYDGDGNFSALCVNSRFLWAATVNSPPRKNPPCVSLALELWKV